VAEAKNRLPALIDKALRGEEVVITKRGEPVAELLSGRPASVRTSNAIYEWLRDRRRARKSIDVTSVDLLDQHCDAEER
jgi:prevent-host-death family protein